MCSMRGGSSGECPFRSWKAALGLQPLRSEGLRSSIVRGLHNQGILIPLLRLVLSELQAFHIDVLAGGPSVNLNNDKFVLGVQVSTDPNPIKKIADI